MTVRYRHRMNFTFNSLKASEKALSNLRNRVWEWKSMPELAQLPAETEEWRARFWEAVNNDLDLPTGLAITWGMVRSELPPQAKLSLLMDFDRVFGLDLDTVPSAYQLPEAVVTAASQRTAMRDQVDYATADSLRGELASSGYVVQDTPQATRIRPKTPLEQQEERWDWVSSSREVESGLDSPDRYDFTFIVNAYNYVDDIRRCITAVRDHAGAFSVEIIAIDNGSTDETADWLEGYRGARPRLSGDPLRPRYRRRRRQEYRGQTEPRQVHSNIGRFHRDHRRRAGDHRSAAIGRNRWESSDPTALPPMICSTSTKRWSRARRTPCRLIAWPSGVKRYVT